MFDLILQAFGVMFLVSLVSYFVPFFFVSLRSPQDLAKKYPDAKWAMVTGGSSGIGRAIVERLASQGLNVVVVAYPDALLESSVKEYEAKFADCKFRKIGANLAEPSFLESLAEQTKDLDISLLFNNAGYIKSGFFAETPLKAQLDNHNCNATSVLQITHHYLAEMRKKGLKGCITFTSSPAGLMPCPTSLMYGSTKCYLTLFAMSLAAEIRADGIDVCVVHPSPVQSNFYKNAPKLGAVEFFKSTATGPETIVNALFGSIGRTVVRDQGYYPAVVKLLLKIVDVNLIADITAMTASNLDDYKNLKAMNAPEKDDLPTTEASATAKKTE